LQSPLSWLEKMASNSRKNVDKQDPLHNGAIFKATVTQSIQRGVKTFIMSTNGSGNGMMGPPQMPIQHSQHNQQQPSIHRQGQPQHQYHQQELSYGHPSTSSLSSSSLSSSLSGSAYGQQPWFGDPALMETDNKFELLYRSTPVPQIMRIASQESPGQHYSPLSSLDFLSYSNGNRSQSSGSYGGMGSTPPFNTDLMKMTPPLPRSGTKHISPSGVGSYNSTLGYGNSPTISPNPNYVTYNPAAGYGMRENSPQNHVSRPMATSGLDAAIQNVQGAQQYHHQHGPRVSPNLGAVEIRPPSNPVGFGKSPEGIATNHGKQVAQPRKRMFLPGQSGVRMDSLLTCLAAASSNGSSVSASNSTKAATGGPSAAAARTNDAAGNKSADTSNASKSARKRKLIDDDSESEKSEKEAKVYEDNNDDRKRAKSSVNKATHRPKLSSSSTTKKGRKSGKAKYYNSDSGDEVDNDRSGDYQHAETRQRGRKAVGKHSKPNKRADSDEEIENEDDDDSVEPPVEPAKTNEFLQVEDDADEDYFQYSLSSRNKKTGRDKKSGHGKTDNDKKSGRKRGRPPKSVSNTGTSSHSNGSSSSSSASSSKSSSNSSSTSSSVRPKNLSEWTAEENSRLWAAHGRTNPKTPNFWEEIAAEVNTRNAEECKERWEVRLAFWIINISGFNHVLWVCVV
jgi:hypothetical protein